jgi:hypothetical protein
MQKAICLEKHNILKTLNLCIFGTEVMTNFFKTAVFKRKSAFHIPSFLGVQFLKYPEKIA